MAKFLFTMLLPPQGLRNPMRKTGKAWLDFVRRSTPGENPRQQVGGCKPPGRPECELSDCTCTAISGTSRSIGMGDGRPYVRNACGPFIMG